MSEKEFGHAIIDCERPLFGFALKLTHDRADAHDLMQETFIKAYTNKSKFKEGTNLKAWLYTIMRNAFISDYQKTLRRQTYVDNSEDLHLLNNTQTVKNHGEHHLSYTEILSEIERREQKIMKPFMMYSKGFKYKEIADALDIPLGTVKNRIHVAREQLQDYINKYRGGYRMISVSSS